MIKQNRREFLKLAGLSAICAGFGQNLFSAETPLEKIVLMCIDDFANWYYPGVQEGEVEYHVEHKIPVTLGVIPAYVEEPLLTRLKEWNGNKFIEIAQHDYDHDTIFIGQSQTFQYDYIKQGVNAFNSWGIPPKSFIPARGEADDNTILALRELRFHTFYNGLDVDLTPTKNPLLIFNQLHLAKNNFYGPTAVWKSFSTLKTQIDNKISQYGVALVLYHVQDFLKKKYIDFAKLGTIRDYTNTLKQQGYKFMTVDQYWQKVASTAAKDWGHYQ